MTIRSAPPDLRAAVAAHPVWYHTMELAPGVVTPGWFDHRPIMGQIPWPDISGKRCLDVGSSDGFFAFELERRGAGEVIATDIDDPHQQDWAPDMRASAAAREEALAVEERGTRFRIAKEALGSSVERVGVSVYDLSPERLGTFDFVVCGSLLLHLRDPLRALEAIRGVCRRHLLSAEQVSLGLSLVHPRRPLSGLVSIPELQWLVPNVAGHRGILHFAGFDIERASRPYAIPFGRGHPPRRRTPQGLLRHGLARVLTGATGAPHSAVLARRRA